MATNNFSVLQAALTGQQDIRDNYVVRPGESLIVGDRASALIRPGQPDLIQGDAISIGAETSSSPARSQMPPAPTKPPRPEDQVTIIDGPMEPEAVVAPEPNPVTTSMEDKIAGIDQSLADISEQQRDARRGELLLSGAKFALGVMNAQSAYASFEDAAIINMQNSRFKAFDAIQRGKQRSLFAAREGQLAAEDVRIQMAAQGQDVQGSATQELTQSFEQIGLYNAMKEESDAVREALGFELEEVAMEYELDQRKIERDTSIISSALSFGAETYANRALL